MEKYLVLYKPGSAWKTGESIFEQDLAAHGAYLKDLFDAGNLISAGPFSDSSGGMAIIAAESEIQANNWLSEDPAIKNRIFTGSIQPLYLVDWASYQA